MKIRIIIAVVLIIFAAASLVYTFSKDSGTSTDTSTVQAEDKDQIYAFYLHGNKRCQTCNTIEKYSHEAIDSNFTGEIADGKIIWQTLNFEEPENEHYITDFELYAHSLVLVELAGDSIVRYKNLERVWELVGEPEAFYQYVRDETADFLKGV